MTTCDTREALDPQRICPDSEAPVIGAGPIAGVSGSDRRRS
ncbi:hypothetical protein QMK17_04875 [Rhodococcus sp. G-MC3]|nr:hypothetical protein [Rhodococcus sp. G-MC3]MDJ0392659.1 hypothetical protein [Rhodococcus sp. G-MC3]